MCPSDDMKALTIDCGILSLDRRFPPAATFFPSACVQMPSLSIIPKLEQITQKPVISAAVCTVYSMLKSLNLEPIVPDAGTLLAGDY